MAQHTQYHELLRTVHNCRVATIPLPVNRGVAFIVIPALDFSAADYEFVMQYMDIMREALIDGMGGLQETQ